MDPSRLAAVDTTTFDVSEQLAARCVARFAILPGCPAQGSRGRVVKAMD